MTAAHRAARGQRRDLRGKQVVAAGQLALGCWARLARSLLLAGFWAGLFGPVLLAWRASSLSGCACHAWSNAGFACNSSCSCNWASRRCRCDWPGMPLRARVGARAPALRERERKGGHGEREGRALQARYPSGRRRCLLLASRSGLGCGSHADVAGGRRVEQPIGAPQSRSQRRCVICCRRGSSGSGPA